MPGSGEARIGGDWYDAIPLRDGRIALVIGDVVGRGIEAAARMAHLQSAVRAYALDGLRPSLVLERMNGFIQELEKRCTATVLLAVIDPDAETVRLASAGHPPPLLIDAGGEVSYAEGPHGNPLGASHFPSYEETVMAFRPGSVLLLYTDGLVERPDQPLASGLDLLRELGSSLPEEPDEACRALLDRALADGNAHDDVAILIARLDAPPVNLDLVVRAEPGSLVGVRRALGRWLRAAGVGDAEAYEIQVACGEACTNAITHAYPPGEAHFAVRASRDGSELAIEVGGLRRLAATARRVGRPGPGADRAAHRLAGDRPRHRRDDGHDAPPLEWSIGLMRDRLAEVQFEDARGDTVVATVAGEIDGSNAAEVRRAVAERMPDHGPVADRRPEPDRLRRQHRSRAPVRACAPPRGPAPDVYASSSPPAPASAGCSSSATSAASARWSTRSTRRWRVPTDRARRASELAGS